MKHVILILLLLNSLQALVNGDFDGDDSVWTAWSGEGSTTLDLDYTANGPSGGSGEALRIVASDWANGGVYQAINLDANVIYGLSGLTKGFNCDQNWLEISILNAAPQQGVDIGTHDIIVAQHFWDCGASAPWNWDTSFANTCGTNVSMPTEDPGVFMVPESGTYYLIIKSGGVACDVMLDNLEIEILDDNPPQQVWTLVWADEFDGTAINTSKWGYDIGRGDGGWGNNEAQYYTNNTDNVFIEEGHLVIQALIQNYGGADYTSARLVTRNKGDWTYGKVVVRAKLPGGTGTWPAIWMLPTDWLYGGWPNSGEIDVMENVGYAPDIIHGTAHTGDYNWLNGSPPPGGSATIGTATSSFHDYTLEWDENYLKWYVDDVLYFTFLNDQASNTATWPFDQRFHLLLNLAIGGTWGGQQGIDNGSFPARLEVDYVRVYEVSYLLVTDPENSPQGYALQGNYPNPFNPTTTIRYALPEHSMVKLTVFDIRGKEIYSLVNAEKPSGNYEVQWHGLDQQGNVVSTGMYFCRLQAGGFSQTIKMAFLR